MWWMVLLAGCGGDDVAPVLVQLPFALAPYEAGTQRAGDLDFLQEVSEDKVLLEFAGLLIDGGTGPEGKILPHLTVRLLDEVIVRAAGDGVVDAVELNTDSDVPEDYEIRIRPAEGSGWIMGYDHVGAPTVSPGDGVMAGDALGHGIVAKKFEFDITDRQDVRWCQNRFFADPSVVEAELSALMADWEAYKGDPGIYDEAAMFAPGCAVETYAELR